MPKFKIVLERQLSQTGEVEVEADTPLDAENEAYALNEVGDSAIKWDESRVIYVEIVRGGLVSGLPRKPQDPDTARENCNPDLQE